MPDDLAQYMDAMPRSLAVARYGLRSGPGRSAFAKPPAPSCPVIATTQLPLPDAVIASVRELLWRNGELALHNRQLRVAVARLQAAAAAAKPATHVANLTPRQQQIMTLVLAGHPSKNIAADLNISQRTVENHRAAIMRRTGAASIPALVRLSLT